MNFNTAIVSCHQVNFQRFAYKVTSANAIFQDENLLDNQLKKRVLKFELTPGEEDAKMIDILNEPSSNNNKSIFLNLIVREVPVSAIKISERSRVQLNLSNHVRILGQDGDLRDTHSPL